MANICVFCSSSPQSLLIPDYAEVARQTGELLGKKGHHLVYGGSHRGLMGIVSQTFAEYNGSHEKITEIIPKRWENLIINRKNAVVTKDLAQRMKKMQDYSDAFITLPGGFGSLQETIEVLVAKQLKMHKKPLTIINTNNFYSHLIDQINHIIAEGLAPKDNNQLFYVASTPQQALSYIEKYSSVEINDKVGA